MVTIILCQDSSDESGDGSATCSQCLVNPHFESWHWKSAYHNLHRNRILFARTSSLLRATLVDGRVWLPHVQVLHDLRDKKPLLNMNLEDFKSMINEVCTLLTTPPLMPTCLLNPSLRKLKLLSEALVISNASRLQEPIWPSWHRHGLWPIIFAISERQ